MHDLKLQMMLKVSINVVPEEMLISSRNIPQTNIEFILQLIALVLTYKFPSNSPFCLDKKPFRARNNSYTTEKYKPPFHLNQETEHKNFFSIFLIKKYL